MTALSWDPISPELRVDLYPLGKRLRDEAPVYRNDRQNSCAKRLVSGRPSGS